MGWLFFPKLRSDYHLSPWKLLCWALARRPTTRASRMIYIQNSYIFSRITGIHNTTAYYYCISHKVLHFEIITVYFRYPARKTLNLQCHTANINTQVLKDPCFDPAPQCIGLERSKNGAVDCAIFPHCYDVSQISWSCSRKALKFHMGLSENVGYIPNEIAI